MLKTLNFIDKLVYYEKLSCEHKAICVKADMQKFQDVYVFTKMLKMINLVLSKSSIIGEGIFSDFYI